MTKLRFILTRILQCVICLLTGGEKGGRIEKN